MIESLLVATALLGALAFVALRVRATLRLARGRARAACPGCAACPASAGASAGASARAVVQSGSNRAEKWRRWAGSSAMR